MAVGLLQRFKSGLWHDNPGLVQLLGLCPLLAVTATFVNGLGLGIATLAVMIASNALVSATRRWIQPEIRVPIYVLIIASLVTDHCQSGHLHRTHIQGLVSGSRSLPRYFHSAHRDKLRDRRQGRNIRITQYDRIKRSGWSRNGQRLRVVADGNWCISRTVWTRNVV